MSNNGNRRTHIWLIPIIAIICVIVFFVLTRYMIGAGSEQEIDYGTTPFVPGESPHSSAGTDSR